MYTVKTRWYWAVWDSISPPCGFGEQLKSLVWCDSGCYELCLWPALQGICCSRRVQFKESLVLVQRWQLFQKHALHSLSAKGNPAFTCCAHLSFWSLHQRLILQSLYLLPSSPLFFLLLSLHPITPQTFTSSPPSVCGYCFSSHHHSCFLHCSISIKNAASFMNSSKWSWTVQGGMQGGNKARRWLLEQTEKRGKKRKARGVLLHCWILMSTRGNLFCTFLFLAPVPFFSWDAHINYMAPNHYHTNEL